PLACHTLISCALNPVFLTPSPAIQVSAKTEVVASTLTGTRRITADFWPFKRKTVGSVGESSVFDAVSWSEGARKAYFKGYRLPLLCALRWTSCLLECLPPLPFESAKLGDISQDLSQREG